ncbi:hypothetical protein [Mesobacillus subterraneus]|uniref:Sucrose phosphatase-like domain-containing protein n=1 Tax=Mesobacillus subterraneus TaxID=285983 RepID=A0A3R9FH42_9BACI|nr:hypothetical protein [Mesobacillus subterraneus]RSD26292.1 hypothetical protein EJA10_15920 [Mesobacillus subterraneus]
MMFATDLDRTIIYSRRALKDLGTATPVQLQAVEKLDGKDLSFMTEKAIQLLHGLSEELLLVPVTTRTTQQYNRISLFKERIPVKYAVTYNGAEVLCEGKPLPDWREDITRRLKAECASHDDLKDLLQKETNQVKGRLNSAEELFLYYLLEEKLEAKQVQEFKRKASAYGWRVSYQGRKLYFMPAPISKGEAVSFIKEREGIGTLIGAGDSLLDEDFLVKCDHSFIPSHGELSECNPLLTYIFTELQGVHAGEEILEKIREIIFESSR